MTVVAAGLAAIETVFLVAVTRQDVVLTAAYPVVGAAFVVIGAFAWVRRPANQIGLLLCITGLLILAATLGEIDGPSALTDTGVLLTETPIAAVLHVVLAFPSGRVRTRREMQLVTALYALVLVRQAPLVLPGPALEPLRTTCSYLGAAVILIAAAWLVRRIRRDSVPGAERQVLSAVYGYGIALLLFFPFSARVLQPLLGFDASTLGAVQIAGLAVLPVVFAAGVLSGGFAWTHDLDELSSWLGAQGQDDVALRDVLARVLGDPSLQVVFTPDNPADILKSVKRGLYAVNFGGGQVDITTGKFVFSASEAYLIEDGVVTAPVKGATLIGNGPESLKHVSRVGNDLALDEGIGTCGKAGQSVPVGVGMPTIKLDRMTVGGTGR